VKNIDHFHPSRINHTMGGRKVQGNIWVLRLYL